MKSRIFIFIFAIIAFSTTAQIKQDSTLYHNKMQWFKDAKLGIFIHWGIYAVNGVSESWSFYNGQISHDDYLKQTQGFTAENYNPEYWTELIKNSGAKYSVITSKHHDGFALWDTKVGSFSAVKSAAVKKDVLTPFVESLKKQNLKVGIYFSLPDWSHNLYTDFKRNQKRYSLYEEPMRWTKFLSFYQQQLKELQSAYNPDLWWFDGDWEHSADEWQVDKVKSMLFKENPKTILNSRLCGQGDYETPEIGIPVTRPNYNYWELCVTMNDSWGFQYKDTNYKSPQQVIDLFVDCISKGGNLLLDIGPKADGSIPEEQEHILKELGTWCSNNSEAIYGSRQGIPYDHFYGPSSLSKDSTTLYLFVRDVPTDGKIVIKGISNKIEKITELSTKTELNSKTFCKVSWNTYPGIIYIDVPKNLTPNYYTVIALKLDSKIKLFRENKGAIESN